MIDKKRLYLMINPPGSSKKRRSRPACEPLLSERLHCVCTDQNFLLTTIAYVLVLGVLALYNMEAVLEGLNSLISER